MVEIFQFIEKSYEKKTQMSLYDRLVVARTLKVPEISRYSK